MKETSFLSLEIPAACDSNPCVNGGTCVEEEDGYTCECEKGFEGDRCQDCELLNIQMELYLFLLISYFFHIVQISRKISYIAYISDI